MRPHGDDDLRLRVAIVGVGPKGLFALERLLDRAHRAGPAARLHVDLFERHPVAGAGPVYDPGQPAYLRMNVAAEQLDMWGDRSRAVGAADRRSFVRWRGEPGGEGPDRRYPPRALVGRYLADGLARMLAAAPLHVTITRRAEAARELRRCGASWTIATSGETVRHGYDEVLVAVGHATGGADRAAWPHAAPLIPAVFPVTRLAPAHVAPGAAVAVRGFALTFLDAALALTEGRGGVFAPGDHPYRLRYTPSAGDAGVIAPFSRTGRPMLAKPDPAVAARVPQLEAIARSARARILALGHDLGVRDDLLGILAEAVGASLAAAAGADRPQARASAERWLAGACDGLAPPTPLSPAAEIERSLAVGAGLSAPDLPWALGHTWRALYPAIVTRLSHGGLPAGQRPAFHALAAQMERVAFGPPAVNAAKLLALIAAGRVDLAHVAGARPQDRSRMTLLGDRRVDVVIDAVLPPPGARRSGSGLLERLVAGGHARIAEGGRGLQVDADGGCVAAGGHRTSGLSAIGRPTEDWVIGNDTLNRALHPHADAWARRVVARATREPLPQPAGLRSA